MRNARDRWLDGRIGRSLVTRRAVGPGERSRTTPEVARDPDSSPRRVLLERLHDPSQRGEDWWCQRLGLAWQAPGKKRPLKRAPAACREAHLKQADPGGQRINLPRITSAHYSGHLLVFIKWQLSLWHRRRRDVTASLRTTVRVASGALPQLWRAGKA